MGLWHLREQRELCLKKFPWWGSGGGEKVSRESIIPWDLYAEWEEMGSSDHKTQAGLSEVLEWL